MPTVAPSSGRAAYMLYDATPISILDWSVAINVERSKYTTASTLNFPVRGRKFISEQLHVKGVEGVPAFYSPATVSVVELEVGWIDFVNNIYRFITFDGIMESFVANWNYACNPGELAFWWEADFSGTYFEKVMEERALSGDSGQMNCAFSQCSHIIEAPGFPSLPSNQIRYVRSATLRATINRLNYVTSATIPHKTGTTGTVDTLLDLEIEGDFDYWMFRIVEDNSSFIRLYYTPTLFWVTPVMKFLGMDNFVVNAKSGELIRATLHFGVGL